MTSMTWGRVLTGALLGLVAASVAPMVINMAVIRPLVVYSVVFLALAWALRRWSEKRWPYILTAVLTGAVLVANVAFLGPDLVHPESFTTFVPTTITVLASLVAVVAAVAMATRSASRAARPVGLGALALVALVLVGSAAATALAGNHERVAGDIVVLAEDNDFPERLEAEAGNVGFFIENRDNIRHTFVIEDLNVKQELPAARDRRVEVQLPAGTYHYYCDVPGHEESMQGELIVQ